jgi:acetamidase/formamidase
MTGPIAVRGAEPGSVLEVSIDDVRPGRWGWTSAGGFPSPWNERLGVAQGEQHVLRWAIDPDRGEARSQTGRIVRLRPFMGILGLASDEPGPQPTVPPRPTGGNIDCKELIAGSRLFLPVAVRGAVFSTGDGHGLQGDGEVAGPALECPMERVALTFRVHEGPPLEWPRAETPAGRITFGFHTDLNEAMATALDGMLRWMEERDGLTRKEALALASLFVDLRITQVVNGVRGVHALLRNGAL